MQDDTVKFADSLIEHTLSNKKHYMAMIILSGILLTLCSIFLVFLLSSTLIRWDPVLDGLYPVTEQPENAAPSGERDVTILVILLVLMPFAVSVYMMYLGISGMRYYAKWKRKIETFMEQRKNIGENIP